MDEQTKLQQELDALTERLDALLAVSGELAHRHEQVLREAERILERLDEKAAQLRALIQPYERDWR